MPTGGVLTIEMRPLEVGETTTAVPAALARGRYVRLDVTDTEVWMVAATLERIFEPFFTTKPVGQGTTFTICLPVVTALETGTSTA